MTAAQPLSPRVDDALFRPVRTGNAFEETVERLLQAIKLGVVEPGDRLPPERELADRFNVSRVTLREAIKALQNSGYVESRRGRYGGTFVQRSPPRRATAARWKEAREMARSLDDTLMFRRVLEVGAAEAAASRVLDDDERAHLEQRLSQCAGAKLQDYRRMDSRLHLAIAEAALSPSLTSAMAEVRMRLNGLLDAIPLLERNLGHSNSQHAELVAAILAHDPPRAREAMEEHVAGTAALLHGFLS